MSDKDPTKDPEFQKVVRAFLTTPPKRHEDEKVGKKASAGKGRSTKRERPKTPSDIK